MFVAVLIIWISVLVYHLVFWCLNSAPQCSCGWRGHWDNPAGMAIQNAAHEHDHKRAKLGVGRPE